jgi:hypothetical protein
LVVVVAMGLLSVPPSRREPDQPDQAELRKRIKARLIGAKFELGEAIAESYQLHPSPGTAWIAELERTSLALSGALAKL